MCKECWNCIDVAVRPLCQSFATLVFLVIQPEGHLAEGLIWHYHKTLSAQFKSELNEFMDINKVIDVRYVCC